MDGRHGGSGDRFMTVRKLARRFDVSLTTAHKVTKRLKAEGLLVGDSTNPAVISSKVARHIATADKGAPCRLGLLVTNITSPFFGSLCRHVQRAALELDYQVLVASSGYDFQREQQAINSFLEIGAEGILICPGLADECADLYRSLMKRGIRIVFASRRVSGIEADSVVAHDFAGGALVAGHFLSLGYNSLGYLAFGGQLKRDSRLSGFRSMLLEEGIELPERLMADADGWDIKCGYRAMTQLMERANRPRAVFAFNDLLAIGAMHYCRDHDMAVPQQVAIAGFDNLPESQVTSPTLTTIDYPVESMARVAVQSLIDRIREPGERPPHHILLEPHLVVRESTDPRAERFQESPRSSGTSHEII